MLATGRGSIAHVQYTGDEAAAEIHKLLHAVVSAIEPPRNRVC
jgi:pre-mRNA-processing factor 39